MLIKQFKFLAALALASSLAWAQQSAYDSGQQALQERQWNQAASAFGQVIEAGDDNVDAALYWQAYALFQSGSDRQARRAIERLQTTYPDSPWVDDAQALMAEHSAGDSHRGMPVGELDDELKIYALAALMDKHPQRALPLAINLLRTSDNPEVREQALFIIATSDAAQAKAIVREVIADNSAPELRRSAIYLLADEGGAESMKELRRLYDSVTDPELKETILYAFGNNDDVEQTMAILRRESSPSLQAAAIHALMNMEAIEQLRGLNIQTLAPEAQRALIFAYAETSSVSNDNIAQLKRIYEQTTDGEMKETIIYALGNSEQVDELGSLLRREQSPELQAAIIHSLVNAEAYERITALDPNQLHPDAREALIHAYSEMGDFDRMEQLLQSETDAELRQHIVFNLGVSGKPQATALLMDVYRREGASHEDKEAVLHALMVEDHARELIDLLRQETNQELKSQIVTALANSDSAEAREYVFGLLEQSQ